jgi:hypothetical protein
MADPNLKQWATERQSEIIDAVIQHGSNRKAAVAMGVHPSCIDQAMGAVKAKAARAGYAPGHFSAGVAPGYAMGKVTIQRSAAGVERVWERQSPSAADVAGHLAAMRDVFREDLPIHEPIAAPTRCLDELITIYPIGDPHAGLYAWEEETGAAFDLEEFERIQCAAIDRLVASTPPSRLAILNDKGDSTHADNSKNRTPRSGHELDVHGRHAQVTRVALRVRRYQMTRLLEKHERVIFRGDTGNHDSETALHLNLMMEMAYEGEPRAEIITSPNPYWYYAFGRNLIGTCHGDGAKGKDLPLLMATDVPALWGQTDFRLWIVGHVHHKDVKEYNGCVVEYVRTLAASDAHHHGAGYRSKRDVQAITLHKEDGEVERHTCSLRRIRRLEAA